MGHPHHICFSFREYMMRPMTYRCCVFSVSAKLVERDKIDYRQLSSEIPDNTFLCFE